MKEYKTDVADLNAKLNIAGGLLLIVFLLLFIAYRLNGG